MTTQVLGGTTNLLCFLEDLYQNTDVELTEVRYLNRYFRFRLMQQALLSIHNGLKILFRARVHFGQNVEAMIYEHDKDDVKENELLTSQQSVNVKL